MPYPSPTLLPSPSLLPGTPPQVPEPEGDAELRRLERVALGWESNLGQLVKLARTSPLINGSVVFGAEHTFDVASEVRGEQVWTRDRALEAALRGMGEGALFDDA